jgi:alpha-amylase
MVCSRASATDLAGEPSAAGDAAAAAAAAAAAPPSNDDTAWVTFSNDDDEDATVIRLCGRNETRLLLQLTSVFIASGVEVVSANINTDAEGKVCDMFLVTDGAGGKIAPARWPDLEAQLLGAVRGSSQSTKPAIFGVVTDEAPARGEVAVGTEGDASALESAATEMREAAAAVVALERDLIALAAGGAKQATLSARQAERTEASSLLERKMAAMGAILAARRNLVEVQRAAEPALPAFLQPPPAATGGPGAGDGREIILQGFNWESCKDSWYKQLTALAPDIARVGFTSIWLPPPSDAVSPQGYLPRDLYDLNSKYGTEAELRDLLAVLHDLGLKAIADIVINHRCAHYQGAGGKWNKFGGRLAWDHTSLCSNNAAFGGTGARKAQEDYTAAPNIDHTQERVRRDVAEWMRWLRSSIGFDGWRFDFVKGYDGRWAGEYVNATVPEMAFGEYWDTCSYTDGVLAYNQDGHRQRTVDWCDSTGGTCAAFDFTLKGILQEAVSRKEYWRLADSAGKPPGVLGIWPSRAVTFLENHDTGSTLQHWPFPWKHAGQGYAYILTHPGTPCVFFDHWFYDKELRAHVEELVGIRARLGINFKSEVNIRKAYGDLYAAVIDRKLAVKIGYGSWSPLDERESGAKDWKMLHSGPHFAVWEAVF